MTTIPLEHSIALAGILFVIGLAGVLARRNILFILLSVEIMLNAAGLVFIAAGSHWGQPGGQVMFIFILVMAGAEIAIGLALALELHRHFHTVDVNAASTMKG